MSIEFYKYQGTGNDFILINNFNGSFNLSDTALVQKMCDRKFGIGADGLMVLEKSSKADFKLIFFNPDASLSFCGNGSRCAVKFAVEVCGVPANQITFEAFDGLHTATLHENNIEVSMRDVDELRQDPNGFFINTGAPHVVVENNALKELKIVEEGSSIRYHNLYQPIGTNVNFISASADGISIRTYEKGVENETLSCGTGVTASALVYAFKYKKESPVKVMTQGGTLKVEFTRHENRFSQVRLIGPAEFVFKGTFHG